MNAVTESSVVEAVTKQLFIGGKWTPASNGATFAVHDPATGQVLCEVADASPEDGKAALDAAVSAQAEWAAHPPRERGEILRRAYEALLARREGLALLVTLGMGKELAGGAGGVGAAGDGQAGGGGAWRGVVRGGGLPLVRRGGRADRRRLRRGTERRRPGPRHQTTRGSVTAHHPVELPDGDGNPQDRSGRGRGLHHGRQARRTDTAVHVGVGADPRGRGPAGGRAQRGHHQ